MEYAEIFMALQEKLLAVEKQRAEIRGKMVQLDEEILSLARAIGRTKMIAEAQPAPSRTGAIAKS